ncbi:hypothetical protein JQX13_39065 [Archangium violaceum]|uniref:hypothetical protein n=1 Tax=Archangium violaceum TaxID=83451 RepID=UPI00193C7899|nr:hypothetical protein [Archangium violaceum]QRK06081.1 hypothetical protein JQX13_39065 [Archangium violaceum]
MSPPGLQLQLLVGRIVPSPASAALTQALRRAEVELYDDRPSGFLLQFQVTRDPGPLQVDALLRSTFVPFHRIVLVATLNSAQHPIMDGLITRIDLQPGQPPQPDMLTVIGEDVSVAMDLQEKSLPYPGMNDSLIAAAIIAQYLQYGLIPNISFNLESPVVVPLEWSTQQPGMTDRAFLNALASRNGYVFQVLPGPVPLSNTAYFGPPRNAGLATQLTSFGFGGGMGSAQRALTLNELPASNVRSLSFSYDALAPTTVAGLVQDTLVTDADIPVLALTSLRSPALASTPALLSQSNIRLSLLDPQGMDPITALMVAQGMVDQSTDQVLTATGELDVLRYGSILSVAGMVGVRGAGQQHDGLYYVKQVTHQITPDSYTQSFTLTREGWGTTVSTVSP